jgi:cytosine/adenosine deaminase-related metal-dependent hydrolase
MARKTVKPPIDPLESARYGLHGTIVTMAGPNEIVKGTIFINAARIEAIIPESKPIPEALAGIPVYKTKGTIFPGFIELHNHLSYNCLPMWNVPRRYDNRAQWSGIDEYRKNISYPMNLLGKTKGYVEAIVRYVECKCLAGGVTTSQGIMLFSNAGIKKYYRGIVRNVEESADADLPNVDAHIPDITARDAEKFSKQLQKSSCLLLHLSEGTNASARKHFENLKFNDTDWAIGPSLAGIHCVALQKQDYAIMKQKGASMVWSPFSNLLLYGQTADIKSAKESGITIALGSDWAPSGSKNMLGELKVAKLYNDANGKLFSDYELVAMATKNAARIIKWDKELGTLEKGKRADLVVIKGQGNDPYKTLLQASEKSIALVVVNGTPRFGDATLMRKFGSSSKMEAKTISKRTKLFNLQQTTQNEIVGTLTLSAATQRVKHGLLNIRNLANRSLPLRGMLDKQGSRFLVPLKARPEANAEPEWVLVLDHNEEEGEAVRPNFDPMAKHGLPFKKIAPMEITPDVLVPIKLDGLTVAGDSGFFKKVASQMNLPDYIKTGLKKLYGDL